MVSADRGDEAAIREFVVGRWARLCTTLSLVAAGVIVAVFVLGGGGTSSISDVTVGPGDSLWSIAQQMDPDADARSVVDQIKQINGLQGDALSIGAVLQVPTSGH